MSIILPTVIIIFSIGREGNTVLMNNFQPYGRVSARDRDRRRAGWDLRFVVLMVFPVICLVVVLYEFLYLQQYTSNGNEMQDTQLQERNARLRSGEKQPSNAPEPTVNRFIKGRKTMIMIANYRDSKRYVWNCIRFKLFLLTFTWHKMRRNPQIHFRKCG